MRRNLAFMAVLCLAAVSAATATAQPTSLRGRSLAEALHVLEGRGLRLIYSTDVVRPEMIVGVEPRSTEPRQMLDELLREHHLHATNGPRGSIVIVHSVEGMRGYPGEPVYGAMKGAVAHFTTCLAAEHEELSARERDRRGLRQRLRQRPDPSHAHERLARDLHLTGNGRE